MSTPTLKKKALYIKCVQCPDDSYVCGPNPQCEGRVRKMAGEWVKYGIIKFPKPVKEIGLELRLNTEGQMEVRVGPRPAN